MPHLRVQFSAGVPFIDLFIGISKPRQTALEAAKQSVPPPMQIRGLIDTGASGTCIDPTVVNQLSLVPTGTTQIRTPSTGTGTHPCNQFDVSLILHHPTISFTFQALPVVESQLLNQGFHALIGRDVLQNCLFVYDGPHQGYTLAF